MRARLIIYEQEAPLSLKRSAFVLYQHEIERVDPDTSKKFTSQKALSNVIKWMTWQKARHDEAIQALTPTQKKLLYLLVVEGLTQKQMALILDRDFETIRHHFKMIKRRMGVSSLYQVVAVAVERGWINAPKMDD